MESKFGVVAFAFGAPKSILANLLIATIAKDKAYSLGARIYTQSDVPIDADRGVDFTPEVSGSPPPTLLIARGALDWAMKNKINFLYVVAAKPHLSRCLRDMKQALQENSYFYITIAPDFKIQEIPQQSWFCNDSSQSRTRSSWNWWSRELILRILPFAIYKRVAG